MNVQSLFVRLYPRCSSNIFCSLPRPICASSSLSRRTLATKGGPVNLNTQSSPLSQSLDTKHDRSMPRHDSVGPFQLGLSQASLQRGEKVKKWSELSTGGKVLRSTARTTNLTVILLGAGLSVLLVYSLTTELFSKNSPTVLYGDACERIKSSLRVAKYLNGPYTFHNNPPSAIRPRHRNRHVTSQIMVDSYGHEHMIMTFYIQGRPEGAKPTSEESYLEVATEWAQEKLQSLSEVTVDGAVSWSQERASALWDRGLRAFKYLTGSPLPPPPLQTLPLHEEKDPQTTETSTWSFAGMFSSLKGPKKNTSEPVVRSDGRVFTDGEVHADLVRNSEGYFVFRYLLVDIPSSRDRNPVRIFVERAPGVRENEAVMRWKS